MDKLEENLIAVSKVFLFIFLLSVLNAILTTIFKGNTNQEYAEENALTQNSNAFINDYKNSLINRNINRKSNEQHTKFNASNELQKEELLLKKEMLLHKYEQLLIELEEY